MISRIITTLLSDAAYSGFSFSNFKLKEDVRLFQRVVNSMKDVRSKEGDLHFMNMEKFSSFDNFWELQHIL